MTVTISTVQRRSKQKKKESEKLINPVRFKYSKNVKMNRKEKTLLSSRLTV